MRVEKIKQNILKLGPSFRHNWRPFPFQRFPLLYGGISEKETGKNGKSHIEFTAQLVIFVADYRVLVVVCNAGFFFGSSSVWDLPARQRPALSLFSHLVVIHVMSKRWRKKDLYLPLSRELSDPLDDDAHIISVRAPWLHTRTHYIANLRNSCIVQ